MLYNARVWKVYPFRSVRNVNVRNNKANPDTKECEECYFTECFISSQQCEKYNIFCGAKKPFRSRYVEIWEDHQTCGKKVLNFGVEEFDAESKEWVVLGPVLFLTETAPFGEGGSRYAFKASTKYRKFRDATYVI